MLISPEETPIGNVLPLLSPICAAPAATDNPPEPAPITHRSTSRMCDMGLPRWEGWSDPRRPTPPGRDGSRAFQRSIRGKSWSRYISGLRLRCRTAGSRRRSKEQDGRTPTSRLNQGRYRAAVRPCRLASFPQPTARSILSRSGPREGGWRTCPRTWAAQFLKKFGAQVQPEGEPLKERFGMSTQPHGTSLWSAPDVGCGLKVSAMVN
jgi:hypothetical protein